MMRLFAVAAAFLIATPAAAFCDRVQINGLSYHYDRTKSYQEVNPGLGCERQFDDNWRMSAGFYDNSYGDTAVYTVASWLPVKFGRASFGLATGIFYGYKNPVVLPPVPAVSYDGDTWGVTAYITDAVAVIHFTYNWK